MELQLLRWNGLLLEPTLKIWNVSIILKILVKVANILLLELRIYVLLLKLRIILLNHIFIELRRHRMVLKLKWLHLRLHKPFMRIVIILAQVKFVVFL